MLVDELLMRVTVRQRDQCLAGECGPRHCLTRLNIIFGGSSHHQREAKERLATNIGHRFEYPQTHVELTGLDHLDQGRQVSIVQNPTASLADDVAVTKRVIAEQKEPVILVGHSYGGAVITEAAPTPVSRALSTSLPSLLTAANR